MESSGVDWSYWSYWSAGQSSHRAQEGSNTGGIILEDQEANIPDHFKNYKSQLLTGADYQRENSRCLLICSKKHMKIDKQII